MSASRSLADLPRVGLEILNLPIDGILVHGLGRSLACVSGGSSSEPPEGAGFKRETAQSISLDACLGASALTSVIVADRCCLVGLDDEAELVSSPIRDSWKAVDERAERAEAEWLESIGIE